MLLSASVGRAVTVRRGWAATAVLRPSASDSAPPKRLKSGLCQLVSHTRQTDGPMRGAEDELAAGEIIVCSTRDPGCKVTP